MTFLMHTSVQNFQSEHFDCAKEFALRKSGVVIKSINPEFARSASKNECTRTDVSSRTATL